MNEERLCVKNERIYVTRTALPELEEYIAELRDIWETRWLTNSGPKHEALARMLSAYLGVQNMTLFGSGHLALEASLQALGIKGEVVTTPFTFPSTVHAIVRCGLTPVFCDIDPSDCTLDAAMLEERITPRTAAILPVHVYGHVCAVDDIESIGRQYGLKVVYDAAHAFGVRYRGRSAASYGDMAVLSFHATKAFSTVEGGAVVYGEEKYRKVLAGMLNFGITGPETVDSVGGNAKMNELEAAMGICNLRHMDMRTAKRRRLADRYRQLLSSLDGVDLFEAQKDVESNYSYLPVLIDAQRLGIDRDQLHARLKDDEIWTRKYFYPLCSALECYRGRWDPAETPVAGRMAAHVLCLPIYPDMHLNDVDRVCGAIARAAGRDLHPEIGEEAESD